MASSVIEACNSLLDKLASIPFDWNSYLSTITGGKIPTTNMPDNTKLFQNLALWNNQPKYWKEGKGFPNSKPCVYIQPVFGKAMNMGMGISLYRDFMFKIHIIDFQIDGFNEAGGTNGDNIRIGGNDQNFEIFKWRDMTKVALELFFPKHCGAMTEDDTYPDDEHEGINHLIMDFKCSFTDLKGSSLDPDQTTTIAVDPPINVVLSVGFADPPAPTPTPIIGYIWKVCKVLANIVATPDPAITQTLDNGITIPLQYALNNDGTLTIPYLITTPGMAVLTPVLIDNGVIENMYFNPITGTFDNSANGGFAIGNEIAFNASLPNISA